MSFYNVDENKNMNEMGQSGYIRYNRGNFPLVAYGEGISSGDTYLGVNEFCITTEKVYDTGMSLTSGMQVHLEDVYDENQSATCIIVPIIGEDADVDIRNVTGFPATVENFGSPIFTKVGLLSKVPNYGVVFSLMNCVIRQSSGYSTITAKSYLSYHLRKR